MKPASSDQLDSSYITFGAAGEDPLQKLIPPSRNHRCSSLLKRLGIFLAFHVLTVAVAIAGVISVMLLAVSMALMPAWIAAVLMMGFVLMLIYVVLLIPVPCLVLFGYLVLLGLYVLTCFNIYTLAGPYAALGVGTVDVGLFFFSAVSMQWLVNADVRLVNFVSSTIQFTPATKLEPAVCAARFEMAKGSNISDILPHIRMTNRMWVAVLYFGVIKVLMGALSAAGIAFTVIQPAVALFSGGGAPFFADQLTFRKSPTVYVATMLLIWVVGAVGLVVVATLSVHATSWVCGEWETNDRQDNEQLQAEVADEVAVLPTPTQETSTSCFADLESPAAAPSVASTTTTL